MGKIDYAVGNGPLSITSADFNNDSNLDLATPTQIANSTSVLLGKGNGTFQPQVSYPVGQLPVSVAAGDLRNNGIVDLVTVNQNCTNSPCNPGSVSVLLGNGDGTFQPHVDYNVGLDPLGVAVGDFRGIGKLDLAVANETSQAISILLGKGDGTFQPQVFYQAGLNSQQVVVGDFNGDVKLDLATSSGLLLGNGDGTFQALLPYPSGAGGYIAVGDFNGDGKLDLATSTGLLLGNGDGTFQATIAYPYGSGSGFVATGDFNQDGKLDLVISAYPSTETTLLLGNGDGTFQEPIPYLIANEIASQFTVGDFNGDGVPDLAAPDANTNTVGVMLSAAFKGISPSSLNFGSQGVGTTSTPRTITISNPSNTKFSVASITSSASFVQSNNCGASLSPGASCAVSVTFSPTTTGSQSGTVTITDSTRISPLAVSVSGSGVTGPFLALYPARQNFSSGTVGTSSNPLTVMLVNTGNAPLNITGISIAGTNSADFTQTNNCGSSLPAAGSCSVNVTFTPTAAGSRRASLSISDTAPGSPQSGSLVGSATAAPDFAVAPATGSLTSQTISAGQSAKFSLVVSPSGSFRGTVNLGCAITPVVTPAPTCALSSSSVQISGSASPPVTVTVATTAPVTTGTVSQVNLRPGAMPFAWTVMLLGSGWLWLRTRGRLPGLAAPIMVLALASLIACGASGGPSSHTIPGTQAGTYSATITASSGSLNHNMTLTVVVQ